MTGFGEPITTLETRCKCCGAAAYLAGVVDFNKNCEQRRANVLPLAGVPIYYHRCGSCGLLLTTVFDAFSNDDFKRWIYNEQYITVDPDYVEIRPRSNAQGLESILGEHKNIRILDYGGGSGRLAELLRQAGFTAVHSYDPFAEAQSQRPTGMFDFICAFEVLEHTTTPRETMADMLSMLRDPGLLMFSTLVQNRDFESFGINWWYIAPRNGHVTLYSRQALTRLAESLGHRLASKDDGLHILFRSVPGYAAKWFK
jgi:2-polyprenyl-6-hydroxyphenyl methylase/3-demethylubiquinone-9 3-methyltransferase